MKTLALLSLALLATAAQAQGVRTEKNLSLALASQLAQASVAACAANGHAVTATVVDRAGSVRAVARADNAGPQKNPAASNLVLIPDALPPGGRVPVRAGSDVIGAIGVGGAPGGHLDEQCALAALEQAKGQLQ